MKQASARDGGMGQRLSFFQALLPLSGLTRGMFRRGTRAMYGGIIMFEYLLESVVVAFCLGGVMGALVAMQFMGRKALAPQADGGEFIKVRVSRD